MKKLKANIILTTFILSITLVVLGIFGTDTAYVILSRYKLQKVTETLALEYASSLSHDNGQCREIAQEYQQIYNSKLSGIMTNINIDDSNRRFINAMEYKRISNNQALVRVSTTAHVFPAFLRFIGIKGIQIHSVAYAKTEKTNQTDNTNIASGKYYAEFNLSDVLTNKPRGEGDFTIQFNYDPFANSDGHSYSQRGGYFVFGSYKNENRWTDLGYAVDSSLQNKMDGVGICINSANRNSVTFNLNTENKDELSGFTKRVDKIRIYKSNGVSEDYYTYNNLNPCNPYSCTASAPDAPTAPERPTQTKPTAPTPPTLPNPPQPWDPPEKRAEFAQALAKYQQDYETYQQAYRQYYEDLAAYNNAWREYSRNLAQYERDIENYKNKVNSCMEYNENRNSTIKLTTLNNVRLISRLTYQSATGVDVNNCTLRN